MGIAILGRPEGGWAIEILCRLQEIEPIGLCDSHPIPRMYEYIYIYIHSQRVYIYVYIWTFLGRQKSSQLLTETAVIARLTSMGTTMARRIFAHTSHFGLYWSTEMPFCLRKSPGTFQLAEDVIFRA